MDFGLLSRATQEVNFRAEVGERMYQNTLTTLGQGRQVDSSYRKETDEST
jgi:hypothetical protein